MRCFLEWTLSTSLQRLHSKEISIQLSCVGQCLNVYSDFKDGRVSNSIDTLEHRCNLDCVSLFYRYYNGFCLSKISGLMAVNHELLCNTRLSWQGHTYMVDWPVDRTLHDK